jgi:hypothetical protein
MGTEIIKPSYSHFERYIRSYRSTVHARSIHQRYIGHCARLRIGGTIRGTEGARNSGNPTSR